ncbi:hypothetical protein P7K49_009977 [Saguinus oedipus]|uniref:Uncharacterized protein n=1 Tax=Saguinus oedipus TaxID=9490 RepID=A0ABQ9VLH5_SAGOE|nr:hypothetical protein P7K49_009977 [Saguinus oedipus]
MFPPKASTVVDMGQIPLQAIELPVSAGLSHGSVTLVRGSALCPALEKVTLTPKKTCDEMPPFLWNPGATVTGVHQEHVLRGFVHHQQQPAHSGPSPPATASPAGSIRKMCASKSTLLVCAYFQYTSGRLALLSVFSTPASHTDAGCLVSLCPKVTKPPVFPFQILPSPPVPQTTQGFIGWRSTVPGLNKCLELDDEIRSCKGAFARELCWPKQGVH